MPTSHGLNRDAGVAEIVVLVPVLFFLILIVVQVALWYHARSVLQDAADAGARTSALYASSAGAGRAEADQVLASLGGGVVRSPSISVSRSATTATVVIRAHPASVVSVLALPITVHADLPVEVFSHP